LCCLPLERCKFCTCYHAIHIRTVPCLSLPTCSHSDETAMTANQAQGIVEYMPTLIERKSLRDYMKSPKNEGDSAAESFGRLCECEKFMVAMMTVRQSKRKLRALLFKLQFRGCIHDLAHGKWTY